MAEIDKAERKPVPNAVHLVRTTQQINLALSQMADQKASILMGATFVVFTISIGQASRGGFVPWAMLVLALFSFMSAMLAVFAILPTVSSKGGGSNILFFGNFTAMSEDEFADRVIANLHDDELIYRTMLRDIYQNGQVLQRKKYKFLGYAYRVFLCGLVLTVITLAIERLPGLI